MPFIRLGLEQAARQVFFVAAVIDKDDRAIRFQPRQEVIVIPIPLLITDELAVRVLFGTDRIVNETKVRAVPCNASSHTGAEVTTAIRSFPFTC